MQVAFCRSETKNRRGFQGECSLDATGIALQLPEECVHSERTGKMRKTFLYQIVFHGSEQSLPVYQMLSQVHTSKKIAEMLEKFKEESMFGKPLSVIFIDQSTAMLLGCVKAMTPFKSPHEYLDHCYDCLLDKTISKTCFIRFDRPHTVKVLMDNK